MQADAKDAYKQFLHTYPCSSHCEEARQALERIRKEEARQAGSEAWSKVDKNNADSLQLFVNTYPTDPHVQEARQKINELKPPRPDFGIKPLKKQVNKLMSADGDKHAMIFQHIVSKLKQNKLTTRDLLEWISQDHNALHANVLLNLINQGFITWDELSDAGIGIDFRDQLAEGNWNQSLPASPHLERIERTCTEVYFWGIPSSGKTCALAAILRAASSGDVVKCMQMDPHCQGYGYMNRMIQLFSPTNGVVTLPQGTSLFDINEMGFDLVDHEDRIHQLSLVDMAGELLRCMYKENAEEPMSADQLSCLDTMTKILIGNKSKNLKMHFFVLEYGGEKRNYGGLSQEIYLNGALAYIKTTRIFEKDTIGIYFLITKADKANATGEELNEKLREYISTHYQGFLNGLKEICEKNDINNGIINILPFTLGEVCFQQFCKPDATAAENVVRTILDRTPGRKQGKWTNFFNTFKG